MSLFSSTPSLPFPRSVPPSPAQTARGHSSEPSGAIVGAVGGGGWSMGRVRGRERRGWTNSPDWIVGMSRGCLEVMVTDKEMGVESDNDKWPIGEKSKWDSFFIFTGHVLEQRTFQLLQTTSSWLKCLHWAHHGRKLCVTGWEWSKARCLGR